MRRIWGLSLIAVAAGVVVCALVILDSREPVYAGKRLNEWLDAGAEPAAMAVHEIGPAATPWILNKLRREHPRWGRWQTYQDYWRRAPGFVSDALPMPRIAAYDEYRASMALLEVGPQVVPQLTAAIKEKNPAVRIACVMTLESLRERGLKDKSVIEALRLAAQEELPELHEQITKIRAVAGPQR